MDLGISKRRALVMGASRGLGRAIAAALGAEGVRVAICSRDAARLGVAAQELGAQPFTCDLSVRGAARNLVRTVGEQFGGLDIVVVNTGGPPARTFDQLDDEAWYKAFDALWMSGVDAIREALPHMRARHWGRIILVTSVAAREPVANLTLSNSLRAGLHGLVNSLSKEVAAEGITVNALMPGVILTERLRDLGLDEAKATARVPARRIGKPEEFAALAAFIASERAGYITGQAIACDGGLLQSI